MTLKIKSIDEIAISEINSVGGKAKSLASLYKAEVTIPFTWCIPTDFYKSFIDSSELAEKISFELGRKDISEMRWEEIWDCSLRIRNMFLRQNIPEKMKKIFRGFIESEIKDQKVAIRSSSPSEDSKKSSFAGLHESYINISGADEIIKHIKLVWASLWSDSAILYSQELELDITKSSMAVVIQKVIDADISGIAFSKNPQDQSTSVIESVFGLNQGLVDGVIEPDRWVVDRKSGEIKKEYTASKEFYFAPSESGIQKLKIDTENREKTTLNTHNIKRILQQVLKCEEHFSSPQDMEWSIEGKDLFVLQSRPITTLSEDSGDNRSWYLTLTRSFENLSLLREKIEKELIPKMIEDAAALSDDFSEMNAEKLGSEIFKRKELLDYWKKIYWDEFIPFAHGIRIFGQFYNDRISPEDPYEFVDLLQGREMLCLKRNSYLIEMAEAAQKEKAIMTSLKKGILPEIKSEFNKIRQKFESEFRFISVSEEGFENTNQSILCNTILELAENGPAQGQKNDIKILEDNFLSAFSGKELEEAKKYLDLGRCSYKLRDDDNIYLGRIEEKFLKAVNAGKKLLKKGENNNNLQKAVKVSPKDNPIHTIRPSITKPSNESDRQITGQPSSPGLAKGKARVIQNLKDIKDFVKGEILVCDAIDPTMTFVVPLASGIVERRGGMLIHGAIIAREYGIPCVTGVPNATDRIKNGDIITVDGYLGIITLGKISDCYEK